MAKKKDVISDKDVKKLIGDFLFAQPDRMPDGTIKTERYETGIIMFDTLLNGGLPKGRVVAIGAEPGVGKSTVIIQTCGNIVEKYDKKAYMLDAEGGITYELVEAMGYANLLYDPNTNPDGKLFLLNISTIQDIARVMKVVAADPDTAVIVIDSDTAVTDGRTLDDDELGMSNNAIGSDARMWSKASKPMTAIMKQSNACLIIIHQARVDLTGFYAKIVATGGNAAKHMASVEIWGKRKAWIGEGNAFVKAKEDAIGAYVNFSTKKNRLTKPFAAVNMPIIFGRGVSNLWAYKEWLETHMYTDELTGEIKPYIDKNGSWYSIKLPFVEEKVQGDHKVWDIIMEHVDQVKDLVESSGGFSLVKSEAESEE